METAILVHGGAGAWNEFSDRLVHALPVCEAAAKAGQAVLAAGGTAIDAVETAVRIMEDAPVLDAGRGSYPNANGEVEMDALIMDGRTLNLGAVASVKQIQNPITLARHLLEIDAHNFLVGSGAEAFAKKVGIPFCQPSDLLTEENWVIFQNADGYPVSPTDKTGPIGDTVGAVAIDSTGNLAAGTSTGGTRHKSPGRVGDSPLVGSGGYADNLTAAVSATGHGESLMKVIISKQVCDFVNTGLSAQAACDAAIQILADRVNGTGGLIAVDAQGKIGLAYNTNAMPYAFAVGMNDIVSGQ